MTRVGPLGRLHLSAGGGPPPGWLVNFDHPPSRAFELKVGLSTCLGIALVFVLLRLYVKLRITSTWGWEDWTCFIGFGLMIALDAVFFSMTQPGQPLGHHIWDFKVLELGKPYIPSSLACSVLASASGCFVRFSLFFFYLRLFKPNNITRLLIYGGMLASGIFYTSAIITPCVLYIPPPGWPRTSEGWLLRAFNSNDAALGLALAQSVFGTIIDIYLLVIPIRSVFQLQLPTRRKFGVSSIFMIGIIAVACSLGSLGYRAFLVRRPKDSTWYFVPIYNFAVAEISAGIVCSCMPILGALAHEDAFQKAPFPALKAFFRRIFNL